MTIAVDVSAKVTASSELSAPLTKTDLEAANVNPKTGLATDYLNHFNEIEMLVGMLCDMPECLDEVVAWEPRSYIEHFELSNFNGREIVIAAYKTASPSVRSSLEVVVAELNHHVTKGQLTLQAQQKEPTLFQATVQSMIDELRPLMSEARAIINGESARTPVLETDTSDTVSVLFD